MGNGNVTGEKKEQQQQRKSSRSKGGQLGDIFTRRKSGSNLTFFACTDKAQV